MAPPCSRENLRITSHRQQQLEEREGRVQLAQLAPNGSAQLWSLVDTDDGRSFIVSSSSGLKLEDRDGLVGLHPDSGAFQVWSLQPIDDGRYLLEGHRFQFLEDRYGELKVSADDGEWQKWSIRTSAGAAPCLPGGCCAGRLSLACHVTFGRARGGDIIVVFGW